MSTNAAVAAIAYMLDNTDDDDDGIQFMRYWNEGEFDIIRRNWPNVPDAVFIGADPLLTVEPGERVDIPVDENHARAMLQVAHAWLDANGPPVPKDHVVREVVNTLVETVRVYHNSAQLRARIRNDIAPLLGKK